MNKAVLSVMLSSVLALSPLAALADAPAPKPAQKTVAAKGPLAPAGAATVKQAQAEDIDTAALYWAAGGAAIIALTVWAASDHNNNNNGSGGGTGTTTTTTTGP